MDGTHDPHTTLFNPAALRQLIERLEATDVDEFELMIGSSRLLLKRDLTKRTPAGASGSARDGARTVGVPLAAPLTGVFYARPAPDQAPFAVPGTTIEVGQVVALIETMKLFNEVTAEIAGEVVSVVAEQGALVEVGQPLMYVIPRDEGDEA